jgi:hypothetical protein
LFWYLKALKKYVKHFLSNFGFTKSGGQSLTNTDTHITRLEKPKLDDNKYQGAEEFFMV